MSIPDFIKRCDRYIAAKGVTQTWLSKRLFNDTYRLRDLADGSTDIGVKRLERAVADLTELETAAISDSADASQGEAAA